MRWVQRSEEYFDYTKYMVAVHVRDEDACDTSRLDGGLQEASVGPVCNVEYCIGDERTRSRFSGGELTPCFITKDDSE